MLEKFVRAQTGAAMDILTDTSLFDVGAGWRGFSCVQQDNYGEEARRLQGGKGRCGCA
ncbi:hypothetical protein GQ600_12300 [Phytophthora cactorum]|nr:hypothetical protein GQ600_12300 [Phytophthora cactorum]